MLFIHHDEREIGNGSKDRRTRSYHNVRLAAADALPLLGALVVAEGGVENSDFVAENLMQIGGHGGCETDFGHQQNGRASLRQHRLHGRQVDRGLA